ncbi:MAG: class I SAM-dependent methyltransferase [Bacteriovorax sp.]|nr:class I SAM-dependent methyltransferase [Bacteriovorax sp.]
MKDNRISKTAILISLVCFNNARKSPSFVLPGTLLLSKELLVKYYSSFFRFFFNSKLFRFVSNRLENLILPGFSEHVLRRKWWIYQTVLKWVEQKPNSTLFVIGAGLDGLGLECSLNKSFKEVFEVDHPATQNLKLILVKNINTKMLYIGLDLTRESIRELAPKILSDRPVIVVWEAVSMYLSEQDVRLFFTDLAFVLPDYSEIIFTYIEPDANKAFNFHKGKGLINFFLKLASEPFKWGIDPKDLKVFLNQCHLELLEDVATIDVEPNSKNRQSPCRGERVARAVVLKP